MKHYLSIEEASEFLTLSKSHLYRLTCYRRIPFCKVGRRLLFDPVKLQEWAEQQAVEVVN
jgi:excisionase family DNA binding protein